MYITMHCNIIAMMYMTKKRGRTASMDIRMVGYEVVEKVAKPCATSGRILVPVHWVGKRVKAVLVEP
jgi:putative transposon-encoded protein